jgi:hypothetical protein
VRRDKRCSIPAGGGRDSEAIPGSPNQPHFERREVNLAYWESGSRREVAETVVPQGPRDMARATLPEAQSQGVRQ